MIKTKKMKAEGLFKAWRLTNIIQKYQSVLPFFEFGFLSLRFFVI